MSPRLSAAVVAVVLATSSRPTAQQLSLANLAAQEAERRQAMTQPSKTYTNADVKAESNPAPVTASRAALPLSQPPLKSDHDLVRERGADEFERAVIAMAQQADDLDTERRHYSTACKGHSSPRFVFGSRWIWIDNESLPECLLLRSDIASLAKGIRTGMEQALEDARRADVYPGTVRDIRRKYALDGSDWDR
jgi:hypothetical protein